MSASTSTTETPASGQPERAIASNGQIYQGGCTAHQVRRLSRALIRVYDQAMEPTGMTIGQFAILRALRRRALSHGHLARDLGNDRTTLSRTVRPLIERGWIVPAKGDDARVVLLSLSEQGIERLRAARPVWRAVQAGIEQRFGGAYIEAMHHSMEQMRICLEQQLQEESAVEL